MTQMRKNTFRLISTSVKPSTEDVALTASAFTLRAVSSVCANTDTPEMDSIAQVRQLKKNYLLIWCIVAWKTRRGSYSYCVDKARYTVPKIVELHDRSGDNTGSFEVKYKDEYSEGGDRPAALWIAPVSRVNFFHTRRGRSLGRAFRMPGNSDIWRPPMSQTVIIRSASDYRSLHSL